MPEIFKSIIPYVDVDIELSADKIIDEVINLQENNIKNYNSYHNFKKTPNEELNKILSLSIKKSPDITKIATFIIH